MTDTLLTVAHALSDPTRLAILTRLRDGEQCVCTLTDLLDAGQSRLSFHLKVLKDAGLIAGRKEGRWSYYRLCPEALFDAAARVAAVAAPRLQTMAAPRPDMGADTACCA